MQCMPCSSRNISEMQPKIRTMNTFDFLKSIIIFQITLFSVLSCSVYDQTIQACLHANDKTFYI